MASIPTRSVLRFGDDPLDYVRALIELALDGVDGNPGGEDNIAAIAVEA